MRWDIVSGLARAEARTTRRLVRYWVFLILTAIFVIGAYFYYAFLHSFFSSYSASVGSISPRYLLAGLGLWGMVLFMIGLIFLAFDVRARDERERIVEVLDSRPCTNLELIVGRFLGLLFMGWLPLAMMILGIQLFGITAHSLGWRVGEPVEPWSVAAFLILMAVPALSFNLGLVFVFSFLTRNRLITAFASLGFIVATVFILFRVPFNIVPLVDLFGGYTLNFPSELGPSLVTWGTLVQRGSVLALGLGLLLLSARMHPRLDSGRKNLWAGAGVSMLVLGLVGLTTLYFQTMNDQTRFSGWQAAHEERRGDAVPDIESIRGQVSIDPGRSITAELELEISASTGLARTDLARLENALFSLNPGLEVRSVTGDSGQTLEFTHHQGLLDISLASPLAAGEKTRIALTFEGHPDIRFAYLYSARHFRDLSLLDANLILLGFDPSIFHRRYVALLPGIHWLPTAGADVGRGDPDRAVDFFKLELEVDVPRDWLVAGPGRRQAIDGAADGRTRFRFAPPAVLPEAALVASKFERRSTEIDGVEMELLIHPKHLRNLEVFAEAGDEITDWIEERLQETADVGLAYPYDALTLVEVPTTLRGFGGGWRMDTALAPPAMLLMKESSFPTTRFDTRFRKPKEFEDREGGVARAKREVLESFFESDFNGGNIFLGAAKNFFAYQTAGQGTGAMALDFICHDLTNRLATDKQGFFSAHIFGSSFQQTIGTVIGTFTNDDERTSITDAVVKAVSDRPEVWEKALGVALADIDPWEDPERAVNVMVLKGNAMSRWILDGLGRARAGALIAGLRDRTTGRTFSREDLLAVAEELEIDLGSLAGDWLATTALPGFTASDPRFHRLADSEEGTPRYQVALHLRNDEAAPGLLRLRYSFPDGETGGGILSRSGRRWEESDPVRVGPGETIEMGIVLPKPPVELRVEPYLSLNRGAFTVSLPTLDEEEIVEVEALLGARPSSWKPDQDDFIVVDDLDSGFSIEQDEKSSGLRLGAKAKEQTLDQGLPVALEIQLPNEWSRRSATAAFGKYRRTAAMTKKGKGLRRAVFTAEVPKSGPWRLELHMSLARSLHYKQGTYHLKVKDSSGDHDLTFDASAAEDGWNMLGELEIAGGEVRVALSDETDGRVVYADAIRWRPARSVAGNQEESDD